MIARVDDVEHFSTTDMAPSMEFPYVLLSRMKWSKNVLEEKDAPDQLVFGSMDSKFCPIFGLAIHLDHRLMDGEMIIDVEDQSLFGVSKKVASAYFIEITGEKGFLLIDHTPIGTHSIRKLPAIFSRLSGCASDDVDSRGRWKRKRALIDRYIDVVL